MGAAIARQYGVTPKAVRDIWKRRTWADITSASFSGVKPDPDEGSDSFKARKRPKQVDNKTDDTALKASTDLGESRILRGCSGIVKGVGGTGPVGLTLDLPKSIKAPPRKFCAFQYSSIQPIIEIADTQSQPHKPDYSADLYPTDVNSLYEQPRPVLFREQQIQVSPPMVCEPTFSPF